MAMSGLDLDVHELLACPLSTCREPPKHSNLNVDGLVVPSALRFKSSDSTTLNTPSAAPTETLCAVVSHSVPSSEHVSGIHSVLGFS